MGNFPEDRVIGTRVRRGFYAKKYRVCKISGSSDCFTFRQVEPMQLKSWDKKMLSCGNS